jgi:hypothetical protein
MYQTRELGSAFGLPCDGDECGDILPTGKRPANSSRSWTAETEK